MDFFDTLMTDYGDRQALEKKQNRTKFYILMKEKGFDFNDVDEGTKLPKSLIPVIQNSTDEFHAFNAALLALHKDHIINLADAVTYIITDYLEAQIALKCLDELNFYTIKTELLKRYRLKDSTKQKDETSLLDFLDADND